jgi:hypothetical protein
VIQGESHRPTRRAPPSSGRPTQPSTLDPSRRPRHLSHDHPNTVLHFSLNGPILRRRGAAASRKLCRYQPMTRRALGRGHGAKGLINLRGADRHRASTCGDRLELPPRPGDQPADERSRPQRRTAPSACWWTRSAMSSRSTTTPSSADPKPSRAWPASWSRAFTSWGPAAVGPRHRKNHQPRPFRAVVTPPDHRSTAARRPAHTINRLRDR